MTTRKSKNSELWASLAKESEMAIVLSHAVQASSCGITIADARKKDMPLIYVNEAFVKMSGYAVDEVLGKNCRFLQGKDKKQASVAQIRKAIQLKKSCVAQIKNYRKDGSLFWNELRLAPVFDQKKALQYYIGVQTDITESMQLNQMKEEYRKELEDKVRERTERLEKKNIALTEVLSQIEIEKKKMNQQILENMDSLVIPSLEKLKMKFVESERKQVEVLIKNLKEMTSPFGTKITRKLYKLTPKEIEICNLIRSGTSTKEIAELNHISLSTVENQRNQIRKKLGISKKETNLASFLQALEKD